MTTQIILAGQLPVFGHFILWICLLIAIVLAPSIYKQIQEGIEIGKGRKQEIRDSKQTTLPLNSKTDISCLFCKYKSVMSTKSPVVHCTNQDQMDHRFVQRIDWTDSCPLFQRAEVYTKGNNGETPVKE